MYIPVLSIHLQSYFVFQRNRDRRDSRWESRDHDDRAGEKWMTDTPTNTIILRGMPLNVEEKDVGSELQIRWGIEDNLKIIFLISQGKHIM